MMEPIQTQLINDIIHIQNSGVDWVAWIALGVSIFATVGTLWWQNHIRKKDLAVQRAEKEADDIMRKRSAEYPYKLKLFTDFYDVLFRFVNYKGSAQTVLENSGTKTRFRTHLRLADLQEFYSQINRIDEECKVLFPGEIECKVHEVYEIMNHFMYAPLGADNYNMFDVVDIIENNSNCMVYKNLQQNLKNAQNAIRQLKLEEELRKMFRAELELGGDQCQK